MALVSNPITADMIMFFKMNETAATSKAIRAAGIIPDLSQAANPPIVPGKIGNARNTNAVDRVFYIGPTTLLQPQTFTITAWVLAQTSSTTQAVIFNRDRAGGYTSFALSSADSAPTPGLSIEFDDAGTLWIPHSGPLSLNVWHQVVASYDGTTGDGVLYVDGVLSATGSVAGSTTIVYETDYIAVCRDIDDGNRWWPGYIDEIAIYDTVKTAAWVSQSYAIAFPSNTISPTPNYGSDFALNHYINLPYQRYAMSGENLVNKNVPFMLGPKGLKLRKP